MPFGEKGRKPGLQQLLRHFLRSGLKTKIAKLRPFPIPPGPPGHDSWVVGDVPYISLHFLGADHYANK
jgi:hypothetical protein